MDLNDDSVDVKNNIYGKLSAKTPIMYYLR